MEQHSDEAECHLNYINYLRYSGNFEEAFSILKNAIHTYDDENQKNRFYLQQLILFYNIKDFSSIQKLHNLVNIKIARERSLKEYYFIMAHTEFMCSNYKKSHYYYNKCINYLIKNHIYLDLSVAYNDLGIILHSEELLQKSLEYKNLYLSLKHMPPRTNVTLEFTTNN
jgi:tetratricopeptide (TPR) repeat protein